MVNASGQWRGSFKDKLPGSLVLIMAQGGDCNPPEF
jgi:hypothetical protein